MEESKKSAETSKGIAMVTDTGKKQARFKREDGLRVEEQFDLSHLQQLKFWFAHHQPPPVITAAAGKAYSPAKKALRQPGLLTPEEFKETLVKVLGTHEYDDQMDNLFTKLDTSCDGYVDWNEFTTYMLLQFRENDHMRGKKHIPFRSEARIRHIVHNRQETTTKILSVEGPIKYVTVSKEGAICVWDTQLHMEKHYSMTEAEEDPRMQKRRVKVWVTDAVYMPNVRKVAIGSTGRDIRFFDATSSQYFEEFHLFGLPDVPCCMTYYYDRKNIGNESLLIYGDDKGDISIFSFVKPVTQLFETPFKKGESVQDIFFKDFQAHARWVRHTRIEDVHSENIRKVMYLPENNCILSSSASPSSSVVATDVLRKKKTYVFNLSKGCECFDYSKTLNVMVTGSTDHVVRLWNPYVVSKAVALLEGHAMGVVDVKIHEGLNQIFSYSRDAMLKVWDIKEHACLQTIFVKFPGSLLGRLPEYGAFPMHLHLSPCNSLLVTANDYVAMLKLGPMAPPASLVPTTHMQQLCAALYNPFFKTVVTGADDSTIGVWELESGAKSMLFTNAHGNEEITCMTFDSSWRRLMTGSRNGVTKVWNIQNGHNLHVLEPVMDSEVTGIVPLSDKKSIATVGWNRMITQYDDSNPDNTHVKAVTSWKGGHIHQEDILAVDYCPPHILATASFDGDICVWSLETQMLLRRMSRRHQTVAGSGRSGRPRASSSASSKRLASASSSRATTPAGSNSRPNSRHRKSHKPPPGQPAPVDKLLFLQARAKVKGTEAATLISCEAGTLRWWSIYNSKHELGYFYAPEQPEESVLGLCTNPYNSVLISGDTQGRIAVWSILGYCTVPRERRTKIRPTLEFSWLAHEASIVSVGYVEHEHGTFVLSASTDRTAKLWSLQGQCVGTFGQKTLWNLKDPCTWADAPDTESEISERPDTTLTVSQPESSTPNSDFPEDLEEGKGDRETVSRTGKEARISPAPDTKRSKEKLEVPDRPKSKSPRGSSSERPVSKSPKNIEKEEEEIPTLERGDTLSLVPDETEKKVRLPKVPKAVSVGPGVGRHASPQMKNISGLKSRSKTFAYGTSTGTSHSFSSKTLLGRKAEIHLEQRGQDRQERREHFSDVDYSQTNRMGKLCCPYQMLETPGLSDIQMPSNLPVSMRMQNQGYTSESLTTDALRHMDLTYWGEGPPSAGHGHQQRSGTGKQGAENRPHRLPALRKSKTHLGFGQKPQSGVPGRTSVY